ncbi:MAG: alpha/beta fold hydrolase [Tumebacillaceae bacterium]
MMNVKNEYTGAHETGFAEIGHGTLYYERQGVGTPILLLHGLNLDTRMWDGIFETLAQTNQAIRMDLRGFGRSEAITEPFSVYEDIRGLLDHLQVDRAFVVGHSLGGAMALEFALAYPERIQGLFVSCTALFGHPQSELAKETQARMQELIQSGDQDAVLAYDVYTLLDGPLAEQGRVQGPVRDLLTVIRKDAHAKTFNGNFPNPLQPPVITRLEELTLPVLTQYGDLDWPHVKEISDVIASRVPNAKQVLLANTAHNGCMEQPETFSQLVLDFVQTHQ